MFRLKRILAKKRKEKQDVPHSYVEARGKTVYLKESPIELFKYAPK